MLDSLQHMNARGITAELLVSSPKSAIHDFFRDHSNHFASLEDAADLAREAIGGRPDDLYSNLKRYLDNACGITVRLVGLDEMSDTLRIFDAERNQVLMTKALNPVNRNFQLAHVLALASCSTLLNSRTADARTLTNAGKARCRIELANSISAALLMVYGPTLELAAATGYDIDRITATFYVSFEMACHRLTTLQRKGAQGVPFFFLRIDRAGHVTRRFNATPLRAPNRAEPARCVTSTALSPRPASSFRNSSNCPTQGNSSPSAAPPTAR